MTKEKVPTIDELLQIIYSSKLDKKTSPQILMTLEVIERELLKLKAGSATLFSIALDRSLSDSFDWNHPIYRPLKIFLGDEHRKKIDKVFP